jgi:N-methylhydantoinase A/oxoprolinase/acetone carboxylase beta subunit
MSYLLKEVPREHILQIIQNREENLTLFKINVPVVLLGGPVEAYVDDIRKLLATEVILPEHAAVGNAVGGLIGRVIKRVEVLIRRSFEGNRSSIMLFSPAGKERFNTYPEALESARKLGKGMVMQYMIDSGLKVKEPDIEIIQQDIRTKKDDIYPLESKLVFIGTGNVSE